MKIKYALIWSLVGDIDLNILFDRLSKKYPQTKFHNPFDESYSGISFRDNMFDGIKIENVINGKIIKINNEDFINKKNKITIHAEIYRLGLLYLETTVDYEKYNEFVINKKPKQVLFKDDNNESNSLQATIMNFIISDLISFQEISALEDKEYNFELGDKIEINKLILNEFGFKITRLGNQLAPTNDDWSTSKIILDKKKEILAEVRDIKKISDLYNIYESKNSYIVHDQEIFDKIYNHTKISAIKETFILYQQNAGSGWLNEINKKSKAIYESINNDNEVYWKNLRTQIEIWQLNFLSYHSTFYERLHYLERNLNPSENIFNDKINDENKKNYNKHKKLAFLLFKEAKYGLENLATPGHTHDEQLLQHETEKGNERILLLSFLAMSIPMIGAILTPTLSLNLKLMSGTIILLLPVLYMLTRGITSKRNKNLNTKDYLNSEVEKIKFGLNKTDEIIEQLVDLKEIPDEVKETIIKYSEGGKLRNEKKLEKINKRIKSL